MDQGLARYASPSPPSNRDAYVRYRVNTSPQSSLHRRLLATLRAAERSFDRVIYPNSLQRFEIMLSSYLGPKKLDPQSTTIQIDAKTPTARTSTPIPLIIVILPRALRLGHGGRSRQARI